MTSIALIQGHPDPDPQRLCRALANSYADGAAAGGHTLTCIDLSRLSFPLLRTQADWQLGRDGTPEELLEAQETCISADHLTIVYPLWLGTMPALLKAFFEQVLRPGAALDYSAGFPRGLFRHKSARIVVTMGMPAPAYRWYFRAHSLKNLERNILRLVGVRPVRHTLIGSVENATAARAARWMKQMHGLGERAA